MITAFVRSAALALPASIVASAAAAGAPLPAQEAPRAPLSLPQVAEAKAGGAKVLNIFAEDGKVVRELKAGEVVVVREESGGGWLRVEVPGGFPCFVHSDFAAAGAKPGILTVTGNGVLLRPIPASTIDAYPIDRMDKGTELRLLELRTDRWYRVLSPPAARAWVAAKDLTLLGPPDAHRPKLEAAAAAVEAEWKPIADRMAKELESRRKEAEEAEAKARTEKEASEALSKGDRILTGLAANYTPEGAKEAKTAFEDARAKSGSDTTKSAVKDRLDRLEALEALEREKAEARALREKHADAERRAAEDIERKAEELRAAADASGPAPDIRRRFAAIGWVGRTNAAPVSPQFHLEKGGVLLNALACPSGRYDLHSFLGKEIGIVGKVVEGDGRVPKTLVVERLEILSN